MSKPTSTFLDSWRQRLRDFLEEPAQVGPGAGPGLRAVHYGAQVVYLVVKGFANNRGPIRAAALSYTTLLALVPLLAVVLSVSKNFLHEASPTLVPQLMDKVVGMVAPQLEYMPMNEDLAGPPAPGQVVVSSQAREEAVAKIQSFIDKIDAGALGTIGTVLLILVGIRVLITVESTFNDIWGVDKGRSIWQRVIYYWASITLGPLLLLLAMYLTGRAEFLALMQHFQIIPGLEKIVLRLAPFGLLWAAFALLYALMPNTRVRFWPAVVGGIVGGTLWQLNSLLSAMYLSRVVTYSKIYGSIGIIPVLLVGLYFSWLIVLFGAQVSFAAQNSRSYFQRRASARLDQHQRELLACRLLAVISRQFLRSEAALDGIQLADHLRAPFQVLNQIAHRLVSGGLLVEMADTAQLQPARPPESITVADVLDVMRCNGAAAEPVAASDPVEKVLRQFTAAARTSSANPNFCEIAGLLESKRQ